MAVDRRSFIKSSIAYGAVAASGRVVAGGCLSGRVAASGKGMAGVVVTDGLRCTLTDSEGRWTLPERPGVRFVSVTVPSGWRTPCHYIPFAGAAGNYDFALSPWAASMPGPFTVMHIGDSEITADTPQNREWVARAKEFADERNCAFFVHTGDICAATGMAAHVRIMNERTVGRPVFYVVGNHDVVGKGKGEALFEKYYGPCWYSLDAGGVHFIVTPMMWGDGEVTYTVEEIVAWLRNDLAVAKAKGQPVMLLTHGIDDTRIYDMSRLYDRNVVTAKDGGRFDVTGACDFRAVIHGHLHVNYFRRSADRSIEVVSVAPPCKDIPTLQVVHVDASRRLRAENRYGHGVKWTPVDTPPPGGWIARVDGIVEYCTPASDGDRVFVGTMDFEGNDRGVGVYALDACTGRRLWFHPTLSNVGSRMIATGGRVFVQDLDWRFYALEAATGRELWRFDARPLVGLVGAHLSGGDNPQTRSAMTLDAKRGRIYAGMARRTLFAFDMATGKVVWHTQDRKANYLGTYSAPTPCDDVVVGGQQWAGLFGYDANTGAELWSHTINNSRVTAEWYESGKPWLERWGYPVFRHGKLYLTSFDEFMEVEPRTGEPIRRRKLGFSVICHTQPLFLGDRVYFGSERVGLVCLDVKTFSVLWKSPVENSILCVLPYKRPPLPSLSSCPVFWKGMVWATAQDGALYAWDPETGERRERIATGVPYIASANVCGDRLFTVDFTGRVRCFV